MENLGSLQISNVKTNNMEKAICRVCLAKERVMVNIFETLPGTSTHIADMISQCTGIYISKRQAFPKTICRACVLDAQNAFEFKQTFEKSHKYFCQIEEKVHQIPEDESQRLDSALETQEVKKEGFEICFLQDEAPKPEEELPYQVKNEPIEEDLFEGEQFLTSDIFPLNPAEDREETTSPVSEERPFKCSQCHKTFLRERQLDTHRRIHTGHRPFQCEHCPKAFTQKHILKIHILTHTGERPFKCPHCPKAFAQKSTQQTHIRIHTGERPFECSYCPRTFYQQAHLQKHLRKHNEERPYQCSECPHSFSDRSNFKRHCMVHTKKPKKS